MDITTRTANGTIALRERVFHVKRAEIHRHDDSWRIDIETDGQEFDDERWAPYLYHQGLRIDATDAAELQGRTVSWQSSGDPDYEHPEVGTMYVFGHHEVRHCEIVFGSVSDGTIAVTWSGLCDVFWDDGFKDDVPFKCECRVAIKR